MDANITRINIEYDPVNLKVVGMSDKTSQEMPKLSTKTAEAHTKRSSGAKLPAKSSNIAVKSAVSKSSADKSSVDTKKSSKRFIYAACRKGERMKTDGILMTFGTTNDVAKAIEDLQSTREYDMRAWIVIDCVNYDTDTYLAQLLQAIAPTHKQRGWYAITETFEEIIKKYINSTHVLGSQISKV